MKNKSKIIWISLLLVWLVVFLFAFEAKMRVALMLSPIIGLMFLAFGVWVTWNVDKIDGKK